MLILFTVYVQTLDQTAHHTATSQIQFIKSLSGKGVTSLDIIDASSSRPAGCVVFPVSSSASVFLHVKGRVDIDSEIAKANKKLEGIKKGIEKQNKLLSAEGYKEKVAKDLQEVEEAKLRDLKAEQSAFEETIKQFEDLKLE